MIILYCVIRTISANFFNLVGKQSGICRILRRIKMFFFLLLFNAYTVDMLRRAFKTPQVFK